MESKKWKVKNEKNFYKRETRFLLRNKNTRLNVMLVHNINSQEINLLDGNKI